MVVTDCGAAPGPAERETIGETVFRKLFSLTPAGIIYSFPESSFEAERGSHGESSPGPQTSTFFVSGACKRRFFPVGRLTGYEDNGNDRFGRKRGKPPRCGSTATSPARRNKSQDEFHRRTPQDLFGRVSGHRCRRAALRNRQPALDIHAKRTDCALGSRADGSQPAERQAGRRTA